MKANQSDLGELLNLIVEISNFYKKTQGFKVRELELVLFLYINPKVGCLFCSKNLEHNSGSAISRYSSNLEKAKIVNRRFTDKNTLELSLEKQFSNILDTFFNAFRREPIKILNSISLLRKKISENNLNVTTLKIFLALAFYEKDTLKGLISSTMETRTSLMNSIKGLEKENLLVKVDSSYLLTKEAISIINSCFT